jgi:hypothetical protein
MEIYPPPNQIIPQKWQSIFWILLFIIRKKKLLGLLTFEKNGFFGFLYYLRRKARHQPQQFTIEPEAKKRNGN